jgi:hypothetical protein
MLTLKEMKDKLVGLGAEAFDPQIRKGLVEAFLQLSGEAKDPLVSSGSVSGFYGDQTVDAGWDRLVEFTRNGYVGAEWLDVLDDLIRRAKAKMYADLGRTFGFATNYWDHRIEEPLEEALLGAVERKIG